MISKKLDIKNIYKVFISLWFVFFLFSPVCYGMGPSLEEDLEKIANEWGKTICRKLGYKFKKIDLKEHPPSLSFAKSVFGDKRFFNDRYESNKGKSSAGLPVTIEYVDTVYDDNHIQPVPISRAVNYVWHDNRHNDNPEKVNLKINTQQYTKNIFFLEKSFTKSGNATIGGGYPPYASVGLGGLLTSASTKHDENEKLTSFNWEAGNSVIVPAKKLARVKQIVERVEKIVPFRTALEIRGCATLHIKNKGKKTNAKILNERKHYQEKYGPRYSLKYMNRHGGNPPLSPREEKFFFEKTKHYPFPIGEIIKEYFDEHKDKQEILKLYDNPDYDTCIAYIDGYLKSESLTFSAEIDRTYDENGALENISTLQDIQRQSGGFFHDNWTRLRNQDIDQSPSKHDPALKRLMTKMKQVFIKRKK